MKEKHSLFQRFMSWTKLDRFRNGKGRNGTAKAPEKDVQSEFREESDVQVAVAEPEDSSKPTGYAMQSPVRVERMSPREETIMRLREGFRDLSDTLGDINTNIREHSETSRSMHEKIEVLPEILAESRSGNSMGEELMGGLLREVSESGLRQKEAMQSLRSLPVALAAIQENEIAQYKALAAIKDELVKRTHIEREMAESFSKFNGTLEKVGDSTMEQANQIKNLGQTQKEVVSSFHRVQAKTIESFQLSQEKIHDEFRSAQAESLHTFKQSQEATRRKLVWGIGAIAAVLGFIAVIVFGLWMRAVNDLSEGNKEVQRRAAVVEEKATWLLNQRDEEIAGLQASMDELKAGKPSAEEELGSVLEKWARDH